jgi:uncharacterized protein (DUF2336 family)
MSTGGSRVSETEKERVRLAIRQTASSETLAKLAADGSVTVRAALALNPGCGPAVETMLAGDADVRVRAVLADRLARLLPTLPEDDRDEAARHVRDTLSMLAADAAERVRSVVAAAVQAMPEAPRALVLTLARDVAVSVSAPVLRYSPVLTDSDLLDLLAAPSHPEAGAAIAARAGLSEAVVEHIAAYADTKAVAALLANGSIALREATLDALIGRAHDQPSWHEPLVRRPALHGRAAMALSRLVATQLLDVLVKRPDMPPDALECVRSRLQRELRPAAVEDDAELLAAAERLDREGGLTEAAVRAAAAAGDVRRVAAMIAVASGVPLGCIDRSVRLGGAKGLVSLVWKAGYSAGLAETVQALLGRLPPEERLEAKGGAFPLSAAEMEWQVELLAEPAG